MADAHQLQGYEEAAVIRARAGASIMGFITNNEGELIADDVENGQSISEFEPGTFKYLSPAKMSRFLTSTRQISSLRCLSKTKSGVLRLALVARTRRCLATSATPTTAAQGCHLLEDREHWRVVQKYLIDNMHMRVFREWLNLAVLSGYCDFPDYELRPERYLSPRWMPRGWSWVDPLKEVKAYREAEQAGYMTKQQIIAYSGGDFDDNVAELAREQQIAADAGIKLRQGS